MTEADWNIFSEVTHFFGLVPLMGIAALTAWRSARHRPAPSVEWWMIALGYSVSWFADSVAQLRGTAEILAYNSYVLAQAGLIAVVLVPRFFPVLIAGFAVVGGAAVVLLDPTTLWPLHSVTWGSLALIGMWRTGLLRAALLVSFGLGLLLWFYFDGHRSTFEPLGAYQCTRLIGTTLLLWAMTRPFPASLRCAGSTP